MKALCIRADCELFRLGESYDVVRMGKWDNTAHISTGNYFGDILICGILWLPGDICICEAKVENEENIYAFEICERRKKCDG